MQIGGGEKLGEEGVEIVAPFPADECGQCRRFPWKLPGARGGGGGGGLHPWRGFWGGGGGLLHVWGAFRVSYMTRNDEAPQL